MLHHGKGSEFKFELSVVHALSVPVARPASESDFAGAACLNRTYWHWLDFISDIHLFAVYMFSLLKCVTYTDYAFS
jgi:hypothetical protein